MPIEEIGIDSCEESRIFERRLETEMQRNVVRRDLDAFDVRFASGDGAMTDHTAVIDTTPETNISERSTSWKKSDIQGATKNISTKVVAKMCPYSCYLLSII